MKKLLIEKFLGIDTFEELKELMSKDNYSDLLIKTLTDAKDRCELILKNFDSFRGKFDDYLDVGAYLFKSTLRKEEMDCADKVLDNIFNEVLTWNHFPYGHQYGEWRNYMRGDDPDKFKRCIERLWKNLDDLIPVSSQENSFNEEEDEDNNSPFRLGL